ncbi:MAG: 6,7-dimethyl-8-ribityllumazine synthase [Phycisphaerales bacterium JB060]
MHTTEQPPPVAIVVSRYNHSITEPMLRGAVETFSARWPGAQPAVLRAPGAFELVALSSAALRTGAFEAVVALGCVIKGQTSHDQHINDAVAHGLAHLAAESGVPVCFGVITAGTDEQARDRAGGAKGNKGAEAMGAALEAIDELRRLRTAAARNQPEMLGPDAMPALAGGADKAAAAGMNGKGSA